MKRRHPVVAGGAVLLSGLAYLGLAYATPRAAFLQLVLLSGVALGAYVVLLRSTISWRKGLAVALLLRLLWLPATPALSDDFYRFRWDGLLVANGINPFRFRPAELTATPLAQSVRPELRVALSPLLRQLNSPAYYSVYPPVCQVVFGLGARLFPDSETGFVVVFRLFILAAECGSAWLLLLLLDLLQKPRTLALGYLLHPLVIIELTGNLHFEALVIFFVLLACWLLSRHKIHQSALALTLGVATKLVPVLVLPLLFRQLGWKRFITYSAVFTFALTVLFLPFISTALLGNIGSSLRLYFHSFEFNASLYYVLRAIGFRLSGYNEIALIGPGLGLAAALALLLVAWRQRKSVTGLAPGLLLVLSIYYLCATTVHPWYLTPLIAVSIFTRFRYPLVWGGLVMLSYAAYRDASYTESLELVGLEYVGTVAWLGYELLRARPFLSAPGP